jgi:diguanylate cyclase (GGDEF)-like protein
MTVKTIQRDEESRLAELRSIGILDTQAEERYDRFTRLAKRAFNVPFAMLSMVDEKREWFKSRQGMEETELPREGSFSTEAIKQDKVMVIQDATRDPRFSKLARESGIKFYAGCPIKTHRNYRIGTLCIADTTPRNFTPEDHACLQDLACMIEEEIAVQSIANIDDLTSLFNRRGFLGIGQHTISVCNRMRRPATVMFFDLDGFKQVNDQYGHAEGDKVLKNIGTLLLSAFRNSDVVARVGGDEFCVLLTGTDTAHIERPLENLAASVELQNNATPYDIAYSVGVAEYNDRHESISKLMEEADSQMYEQKRTRKSLIGLSA